MSWVSRKSGIAVHRISIEQRHFRAGWVWSSVGAMLVVVAVAIWGAQSDQRAACAVADSVPDLTTAPDAVATSSSGVAARHTVVDAPLPAAPGEARYYAFGQGVACSFPRLSLDGFYVGISREEYGRADLCGAYLDVRGPNGDVRVLVADLCPGCAPGQLDLSTAAFDQIADRSDGVAQIRYSVVWDPSPAPELSYRVKPDSSADWLAILFSGAGNAIQRIALRPESGGPWQELNRGMDNHWTISRAGPGPFVARVTDIHAHQVEVTGIAIEPGERSTGLRLYTDQSIVEPTTPPVPTMDIGTTGAQQTPAGTVSGKSATACEP